MLDFLSNQVDIGIYQYDEFWSSVIKNVASTQKLGFSILVVFVIWIAFTLKYTDIKKELEKFSEMNFNSNKQQAT